MPQEQSSAAPVVLVVENDVLLRLVTASNLRDAGFEVIEAANSAEAIRILDRIPVDVLFSDIDMPGKMDGLALAQWVHQRQVDTTIILTSGGGRPLGDAKEYATFLPKPYAVTDVEHLLRIVLPSP
ncbi:MAG TPA: response regulator [Silvibacterium sp.]|jgi:two-component system, response regulator PdtaR|nr:response regulator [Silvibacterium sp.]